MTEWIVYYRTMDGWRELTFPTAELAMRRKRELALLGIMATVVGIRTVVG